MTTPLTGALRHIANGRAPIPVPFRAKGPVFDGWTELRVTPETAQEHFNGVQQNVGALTGTPSGGQVVVDVDAAEALDVVPLLLPDTHFCDGRESMAPTHFWYIAEGAELKTVRLDDPLRAKRPGSGPARLVELLADGAQCLVWPSVHPTGTPYRPLPDGTPPRLAYSDLLAAVYRVASAALLGRYWPAADSHVRHDFALALAGYLLNGGLPEEVTAQIIEAAARAGGDREVNNRVAGVRTTAERIRAGEPVQGGPTLAKYADDDILLALAKWLGLRRPASGAASATGIPTSGSREKETQASAIVRLAEEAFTFHTSEAGEPFAVAKAGPPIARMLRGGREALRATLAAMFARADDRAPSSSALADALLVVEGRCLTAERVPLHLRLARTGEAIVVDLGRADGQVAVVSPDGWTVAPTPPGIIWRRTELTGELPLPQRGGDLDSLRTLLNVTDTGWLFVRAALVSALLADIPQPVTFFRGPQGAGKSSAARTFTLLIDPSPAPLRAAPDRPEGWHVAAAGSRVVSLDNVSMIPAWLSDAICRASTGDGLVKRRLYSDDSLVVLFYRRVVTLTSIDVGALRGDLADRLLPVELERIAGHRRRLDAEITAAFTAGHPAWLGALLALLSRVLAVLPDVRLDAWPRMADFGRVLAAVDLATGTNMRVGGLARYLEIGGQLAAEVVEGDAVAGAVVALLGDDLRWQGTAGALLAAITPEKPPKGWPTTAHHLSSRLRRASEALRGVGLAVTFGQRAGRRGERLVVIEKVAEEASAASARSRGGESESRSGAEHADADHIDPQASASASAVPEDSQVQTGVADTADTADADLRSVSSDPLAAERAGLLALARDRGWPEVDVSAGVRCAPTEQAWAAWTAAASPGALTTMRMLFQARP